MRSAALTTAFILMLSVALAQGVPKEGVLIVPKVSIPSAEEVKASQKRIRDTLASDYKQAKSPAAKWTLAEKLAKEAVEIKDDPESEYAYASEAIDLYVTVGDALSAFRAVDELALTFDLDPIGKKVELFQKAAKEAKAVPLKRMMALVGLKLAGDAAAVEQYEAAKTVAGLSLTVAKPSRDSGVVKRATEQSARYADLLKQWEKVQDARKNLETSPDDPEANEINGRYLCLVRQEWDKGLPHLVKGIDVESRTVAQIDLATMDDAKSQVKTGNAWWDFAEPKKGVEKQQVIPRVAYWLEKALPKLSGLDKAEVVKRLEDVYEIMSGRSFKKLMSAPANGIQSQGLVDCADAPHPASMGKGFDLRRSWLVSFEFSPTNLDGGWHMVLFWGDGRAGKDPLWFRQDGGGLYCGIEDAVNQRSQGIWAPLNPKMINDWVLIQYVHDTVTQELELYVDHRLVRKEAIAITPQPDGEMNVVLGGTNDHTGQRFHGKVRNVWLGNIK